MNKLILSFAFLSQVAFAKPFCKTAEMDAANDFMKRIVDAKKVPIPKDLDEYVTCYWGQGHSTFVQAVFPMNLSGKADGTVYSVIAVYTQKNSESKWERKSEIMTTVDKFECPTSIDEVEFQNLSATVPFEAMENDEPVLSCADNVSAAVKAFELNCENGKAYFHPFAGADGTEQLMTSCINGRLAEGDLVKFQKASFECDTKTGIFRKVHWHTWGMSGVCPI